MKSFHQFYEQAVASAPAPAPVTAPKVVKVQSKAPKAPKVTDPSSGVDIDDDGRWKGNIVDQGKIIKPGKTIKVKDGKTGPDPDIPSGEANPNKKKKDYGDVAGAIPIPPDFVKDSMKRRDSGKDYSIEDKKNIIRWSQGLIKPV